MSRPAGAAPTWATDDTYASGAHAGEPTKLDPGVGISARGWAPDKRRPAKWDNFQQNRVGKFIDYLDALEVQNWGDALEIGALANAGDRVSLVWVPTRRKLYAGLGGSVKASGQGKAWSNQALPGSSPIRLSDIVESAGVVLAVGEDSNEDAYVARSPSDGAWTQTSTGIATGRSHAHVAGVFSGAPSASRFIVGVSTEAATFAPFVTWVDSTGTTCGGVSLVNATWIAAGYGTSAYNGPDLFAASPTLAILAASGPGQTHVVTWTSADGQAWTAHGLTAPLIATIRTLVYDDATGRFEITTATGEYYYSTDGVTWVQRAGASQILKLRSLATYGGVWVAVSSTGDLIWSIDQGVTWSAIIDPLEAAASSPGALVNAQRVGDRFVCVADALVDGANVHAAYSLRIR